MPIRSKVQVCADPEEFGMVLPHLRLRYGKRGINLSWVTPTLAGVDYKASYKKAMLETDAVLFLVGKSLGAKTADGESYLEYALSLLQNRSIPIGVMHFKEDYPNRDAGAGQSAEDSKLLEEIRDAIKKKAGFSKTVSQEEDFSGVNTEYRAFLKTKDYHFPMKLVASCLVLLLGVVVYRSTAQRFGFRSYFSGIFSPHHTQSHEEIAKRAFEEAPPPPEVTVKAATPLPAEVQAVTSFTPTEKAIAKKSSAGRIEQIRGDLAIGQKLLRDPRVVKGADVMKDMYNSCQVELGLQDSLTREVALTYVDFLLRASEGAVALEVSKRTLAGLNEMPEDDPVRVSAERRVLLSESMLKNHTEVTAGAKKLIATLESSKRSWTPSDKGGLHLMAAEALIHQGLHAEALTHLTTCYELSKAEVGSYHQRTTQLKKFLDETAAQAKAKER